MICISNKRGMAGVMVAIVILSLLMTTSMSYVKIVQTESQVASSIDYSDRAMDAAFSGIQYGMAIAQTQDALFIDNATEAQKRLYVIGTISNTELQNIIGGITPNTTSQYSNLVQGDWLYLNADMDYQDDDDVATLTPYLYKIAIFPKNDGSGNIQTNTYYIRSQGMYRIFNDDGTSQRDYKCQILAEIQIDFTRKKQRLVGWRRQEWSSTHSAFFVYEEF